MSLIIEKQEADDEIVFISCFYPIKKGRVRHTVEEYKKRATRLFNIYDTNIPLFIFTPDDGKQVLEHSKMNKENHSIPLTPNIKFITKYQSVFDIPIISERKNKYDEIVKIMQQYPFYNITTEIGSIWNAKLIFLQEVVEYYSPKSKFYFWIDIGGIKTDEYYHKKQPLQFPCVNRIKKIFSLEVETEKIGKKFTDKILFWGIVRALKKSRTIDDIDLLSFEYFIQATFFGGPRDRMIKFLKEYKRIHDFFMSKNQFVPREELVLGAYLVLNKNDVFMIDMERQKCYMYNSWAAFIDKNNVCRFPNSVYLFGTFKGKYRPVGKDLGSWI